ncbi:VOC family protein [Spirillospora sp. NPDC048911]|uniref:VOC family protein n=1 Tax=Spirillospora sp. NPDC048911 TaxID=3364527 RepID=UPI003719FF83
MSIDLNHTIVHARDKHAEAEFFARILGLKVGAPWGPFVPVEADNGVTFDFMDSTEIQGQHYAFLVTDEEFDQIFARVQAAGITYWADPDHNKQGEINRNYGGRGVYFDSPNGHSLEALTSPYA